MAAIEPPSERPYWAAMPRTALKFAFAIVCFVTVTVADETIPPDIERALRTNAADLSPLTVTWERTRSSTEETATVLPLIGLPKTATEFMLPEKVRLIWGDGKFYTHFWRTVRSRKGRDAEPDGSTKIQQAEKSFDGEKFYSGNPNKSDPAKHASAINIIEAVDSIAAKAPNRLLLVADYLYLAGFQFPQTATAIHEKQQPRSLVLDRLSDGATLTKLSEEVADGRTLKSLELVKEETKQVFLLDPMMNYALRRQLSYTAEGQWKSQVDCDDFARLPGTDCYLPRQITTQMYYPNYSETEPLIIQNIVVPELNNAAVADSQFVVAYDEPGSHIADRTLPGAETKPLGQIVYDVPADPTQLKAVIAAATRGVDVNQPAPVPAPARGQFGQAIVWGNLVAVAAIVFTIAFVKMRRRQRSLR